MRQKCKVINYIFLVTLLITTLTGCSRVELLNELESRDTKYFRGLMDNIFESFNTEDEDKLKNLFSVNVRKENPELDNQIKAFFEIFEGPLEIEEIRYSTSGGSHVEYGDRRTELYNSYDITIKAGDVRYCLDVECVSIDDFNPDNEGIQTLNIATDEAYNSKYYVSYYSNINRGGDKPGLYYQDSKEMRDDIRWIEGRPWRYTDQDRNVTVEELVATISKNDDFKHLISVIGEPNCSWEIYSYYYYELENGLFAVCKTESKDDTIRPKVDGHVARPDTVVAVYIADEEDNLETLWMADDVVQVRGSYYAYYIRDRVLTEDDFTSFILDSRSFSELEDKIGLPSLEPQTPWYYYYELDSDVFVECNIRGDNIEEMSVVDSQKKLYTLWEYEEK